MSDYHGPGGRHDESSHGEDVLETRLRRALTQEAAMVQPAGDGLQRIRVGIDDRRRNAWWRHPAFAVAAAAVLGLVASGLYFGLGDSDPKTNVVGSHSPTPSTGSSESPSGPPSPSTSSSESPSNGPAQTKTAVYVYFVHDDGQSPRLYREHPTVASDSSDPAAVAVEAMLEGTTSDPDYASPWPAKAKLVSYSVSGDTATVNVSKFVRVGAEVETAAVQQLVYTVTANDTSVKRVRLLVKGQPPASGHSDWSQPVARAPMSQVQGLIWILAPAQGARVGSPVTIDGYGTAFEATISWEVRKNGVVVQSGHTQGGSNGVFGPFHDTVTLPPGDYELSAFESSAEDGRPLHIDTKNFTVR